VVERVSGIPAVGKMELQKNTASINCLYLSVTMARHSRAPAMHTKDSQVYYSLLIPIPIYTNLVVEDEYGQLSREQARVKIKQEQQK